MPLPGSQVVPVYPLEDKKAVYASKEMKILNPNFGVYGVRGVSCWPNPPVSPKRSTSVENLPLGDAP